MKQYCYAGDIKKLIPAGWKFQKLYAMDYKTYSKDNIIMFVVSKMLIEIDNVKPKDQVQLIDFILDNMEKPESFWEKPVTMPLFGDTTMPERCLQDGVILTRREASKKRIKAMLAFDKDPSTPYQEDGWLISVEFVQLIKELISIGNIELRDF